MRKQPFFVHYFYFCSFVNAITSHACISISALSDTVSSVYPSFSEVFIKLFLLVGDLAHQTFFTTVVCFSSFPQTVDKPKVSLWKVSEMQQLRCHHLESV